MEKFNSRKGEPRPESSKEKTLGSKIKNAIGMSVLAGGIALGGVPDVEAQTRVQPQRESVKAGRTAKTAWAQEMVGSSKQEINQLQNAEDVRMWVLTHIGPFFGEYYSPTKGPLVPGTYQPSRRLSPDEARFVLAQAEDLESQYINLHKKFKLPTIPNITDQFTTMKESLVENTSYAYQKQLEMLDKLEKGLGK